MTCFVAFKEKMLDDDVLGGLKKNTLMTAPRVTSSRMWQRVTQTCKQKWDSRASWESESEGAAIWEVELFFRGWQTVDDTRLWANHSFALRDNRKWVCRDGSYINQWPSAEQHGVTEFVYMKWSFFQFVEFSTAPESVGCFHWMKNKSTNTEAAFLQANVLSLV